MSDALTPDSPLSALMLLATNPTPFLALTPDEQLAVVRRLRTITQQPVTLKAELAKEAGPKRATVTAKKQAFLDSI